MTARATSIAAVVPVRRFAESKQRLGFLLSPAERDALSRAMLADVLAALGPAGFDQILVVTGESDFSPPPGVEVLREDRPGGLNAAVAQAARHLAASGCKAMLVVPGDLPQLTAGTLESCRDALLRRRSAVLVAAATDSGTNLLGLNPPGLVAPAFGPDSFARHLGALRDGGIKPLILQGSEARFDIDRPTDIARFMAAGTRTETQALLDRIGVSARLERAKALETQA